MDQLSDQICHAPDGLAKEDILKATADLQSRLFDLQRLLYANSTHALLIILQGLDAAGKDSTIRHVFSCVNPMGCNVKSFKAPTEEEKRHSFLWRIYPHVPAKGMIQIFNRSHYEDILVPCVHETVDNSVIQRRYEYINAFEEHLKDNNVLILKFFLHISKEKQTDKLKLRVEDPRRKWKYDVADKREMPNRKAYTQVYEEIFRRCSPSIPWQIVPADQKWYRNYVIAKSVVEKLESLKMKYPE